MKQCIVFFGLLSLACIASALQFTDCGSKMGKFTRVEVSDCDTTKSECILKRNSSATITIDLTLGENVAHVKTVVHGKVLGVEMPFPLKNPDACVDSGLQCPLQKGSSYEYAATLRVLKSYPKVKVDVKWELKDENEEDIVCVIIPAKIE